MTNRRPILATGALAILLGGSAAVEEGLSPPSGPADLARDIDLLSHRSLKRRMEARERVHAAGREATPRLLEVLRGSIRDDPYKLQACIYLLGEIGDPAATEDLLRIAKDSRVSDRRRYWALASLAKMGAAEAVPLARERLASEDGSTRRAALYCILARGAREAAPIFLDGLRSDDARVRSSSATGLRRLSGKTLGYEPEGTPEAREAAAKLWDAWWGDAKEFPPSPPGMPDMTLHEAKGCIVRTDGDEARAEEIAAKVIVLRRAFAKWFDVGEGAVPTRVREFRSWDDFDRYGSLNQWGFVIVSEFFYSSFLHEVVTFRTGEPATEDRGLVHEVFHDFYHRNTDVQLPWFNEGMAEYFETWKLVDDDLEEGPRNLEWFGAARAAARDAPEGFLKPILEAGQQEFYFGGRARNYALSWAVVDHLVSQGAGRVKLRRVFGYLRDGRSPREIVRKAFKKKDREAAEAAIRALGVPGAPPGESPGGKP